MSELKINTILNKQQYQIKKVIGEGGFGITYLADELGYYRQSGFGSQFIKHKKSEPVVVKELYYRDYCSRNEKTGLISISNSDKKIEFQKLVRNQLDEGKIIRSLDHPNIVKTRDIFEENDTAYMVMDYIESVDLEEVLKTKGKLQKDKALKYILEILDAVDYIHNHKEKKILHLDISPSNILIDIQNDNAILIDFGAALSYDNLENKITSTTSQIITGRKKHYSPNEQSDIDQLKSFDATFDTYAVGATLYHLLSGKFPQLSNMLSSERESFVPPSQYVNDNSVSEYLDAVVEKAMSPKYKNRYGDAIELLNDLKKENNYLASIKAIMKNIDNAEDLIQYHSENYLKTPEFIRLKTKVEKNSKIKLPKDDLEEDTELLNGGKNNLHNEEEFTIPIKPDPQKKGNKEVNFSIFKKNKKAILIASGVVLGLPILGFILLFVVGMFANNVEYEKVAKSDSIVVASDSASTDSAVISAKKPDLQNTSEQVVASDEPKTVIENKDQKEWIAAKSYNTKSAYESYIRLFPSGKYVSDARRKISEIITKESNKIKEAERINKENEVRTKREEEAKLEREQNERKIAATKRFQSNDKLRIAKKTIAGDIASCRKDEKSCKPAVIGLLNDALAIDPNNLEARNLLDKMR